MKRCLYFLVILTLLIFTSCPKEDTENCHYSITINNDSDFDIYFRMVSDTMGGKLGSTASLVSNAAFNKINAHKSKKDMNGSGKPSCIEYVFTKGTSFSDGSFGLLDSLRVFIFDAYVLEQDLKYKTLKRYDLTLEDLRKLNWAVSYPPTEEMKDIVMYPPYGQ